MVIILLILRGCTRDKGQQCCHFRIAPHSIGIRFLLPNFGFNQDVSADKPMADGAGFFAAWPNQAKIKKTAAPPPARTA
jgi:hypothetical protein